MPMSIYGAVQIGETQEYFVVYEDGSAARMQVTNGEQPTLTRAGTFVSKEEYERRLDELNVSTAEHVQQLLAQDEARTRTDYLELLGAGIRDESARRMSGYTGPAIALAEGEKG